MISVIIPTYNRADLLPKAIKSVKNQTFKDVEIIVVDDCSTDNTQEIVKQYLGENDTYIRLLQNHGTSTKPRYEGIKIAKGEYICLLDSDDYLDPTCLEKEYKKMVESDPDVGLIYSGNIDVNFKGKIIRKRHRHECGDVFKESLSHCVCSTTGVIIKRECFVVCGLLVEELNHRDIDIYSRLEHNELFLRLAQYYKFDYVDEYLTYCRRHKNSLQHKNKYILKRVLNIFEEYKEYYDLYPERRLSVYRTIAHLYRVDNNFKEFAKYSLMANPNHRIINYILIVATIISPKIPIILSPIYRKIMTYMPKTLKLQSL